MSPKKNPTKTSSGCWNLKLERLEVRDVPAAVANPDAYGTPINQTLVVDSPSGVLMNDSGRPTKTAELVVGSGPARGRLNLAADGSFEYTPDPNQEGRVSFDYQLTDGDGYTDIESVTIDVNRAPIAANKLVATEEFTSVQFSVMASDPDGSEIVEFEYYGAAEGDLFPNELGVVTYSPREGFTGTDSFQFRAKDATNVWSNIATVTIHVGGDNRAPVANEDNYNTGVDVPLTVGAPGVLANDIDDDAIVAIFNTQPTNGTLIPGDDGSFTYTPFAGFVGKDSFTYTVDDGELTAVGTVNITVTSPNGTPSVQDARFRTRKDNAYTGVLNGVDVDGDPLAFSPVDGPANGTLLLNSNGSFTYTPNANYYGTDSFSFLANDGTSNSNTATVQIVVRAVNDAPTLAPATFTVAENAPNGTSVGTLGGADADGDALTYRIVGGNSKGAFAIDPLTGAISVANASVLDFETRPTYHLTVRATDTSGRSARATVTVLLTDVNENRRATLDIVTGDAQNRISLSSRTVEVAILSSATFDARTVDTDSLRFGRTGQEKSIVRNRNGQAQTALRDVNGDGRLDLVVQIDVGDTRLRTSDTRAFLTGVLTNGGLLTADDVVSVRR